MKSYKFRSGTTETFQRDIESLKNNSAWFSLLEKLNDPLEGTIDHENLRNQVSELHLKFKRKNPKLKEEELNKFFAGLDKFLDERNNVGILSLSKSHKNEALWTYYANEHSGFCIEYDFDLLKVHSEQSEIHFTHVKYSNTAPKLEVSDLEKLLSGKQLHLIQKLLATKSTRWSTEEEIRLISNVAGCNYHDPNALTAIYFGYKMPQSNKEYIVSALEGRNVKYFQMELDKINYGMKALPWS